MVESYGNYIRLLIPPDNIIFSVFVRSGGVDSFKGQKNVKIQREQTKQGYRAMHSKGGAVCKI